ncbi:hypothetical protein LP420_07285 [Massilia sp. B-10]|nr:hypothetical protein LP420_07285 [Massilia sp. B-10]
MEAEAKASCAAESRAHAEARPPAGRGTGRHGRRGRRRRPAERASVGRGDRSQPRPPGNAARGRPGQPRAARSGAPGNPGIARPGRSRHPDQAGRRSARQERGRSAPPPRDEQIAAEAALAEQAEQAASELLLQTEQARLQAVERVAAVHAAREEVLHIASADARLATLARERERQAKGARQTAELLAEAESEALELTVQREKADQVALAAAFARAVAEGALEEARALAHIEQEREAIALAQAESERVAAKSIHLRLQSEKNCVKPPSRRERRTDGRRLG